MSILGPNGGGRFVAPADAILATQGETQYRIDRGEFFTCGLAQSLGGDSDANILIQVGARPIHAVFAGSVSQNMHAELYEDTVFSDAGSGIVPFNRLRSSDYITTTTLSISPTTSDFGTRLINVFLPGGSKQTATGSSTTTFSEWILNANTNYLMRVINNVVSPSSAGNVGIALEYYEPDTS